MRLELKRLRRKKGLSQDEMAARLSELMGEDVKVSRYGTWERGDRMMNLEQAYYCAVVLGVTLNDLVGMQAGALTRDEVDLLGSYRACDEDNRDALRQVAKSLSKLPPGPDYAIYRLENVD